MTSDLALVEQVIDDVNLLLDASNVRLETFHWAANATPGVSGREAQERINQQAANYDIIVSIFGARIGTPTANYQSGTVEELSRAIENLDSLTFGGDSVMVFFKRLSLDNINSDLRAAAEVQEYRKKLPPSILYKEYDDDTELRKVLLLSIGRILRGNFTKPPTHTDALRSPAAAQSDLVSNPAESPQELGILDYVEIYNSNIAVASDKMELINRSIDNLGEYVKGNLDEFKLANTTQDRARAAKLINEIASAMEHTAREVNTNMDDLEVCFPAALEALSRTAEMEAEDFNNKENNPDRERLKETLGVTAQLAGDLHGTVLELQQEIAVLPRMTKEFNSGKRNLLRAMERFLNFLEICPGQVLEVVARI